MNRYLPFAIITLFLLVVIGAGVVLYRKASQPRPVAQAESATIAPGADPPHSYGPADAPVTIEEFGDFQCGACVELHLEMKKIKQDYVDRLRVIFRQAPMRKIHRNALDAARAAEAAALQGRFWQMHDWLYQNQGEWDGRTDPRPVFVKAAQLIGLDVKRFVADLDTSIVNDRINLDVQRGESLAITGTPTLFINGQPIPPSAGHAEGLKAAIDEALNREN